MSIVSRMLASEFTEAVNRRLNRVFQDAAPRLLRTATRMLGLSNTADREDVLQDACMSFGNRAVLGELECLDSRRVADITDDELHCYFPRCRSFLAVIVKCTCRDYRRRAELRPQLIAEWGETLQAPKADPAVELMRQEQVDMVWKAISELPTSVQEILTLHIDGQHSEKEIAAMQGVSLSTIERTLRHTWKELQRKLCVNGNGCRKQEPIHP